MIQKFNDMKHILVTFSECNNDLDIIWQNLRYPRRSTIRMRVHEEDLNCILSYIKREKWADLQNFIKNIMKRNMHVIDKFNYLAV